jgi:all-trans-retinol dehydrogenase (NAD+)
MNAAALKNLEAEAAAEGLSVTGMVCDVSDRVVVARQAKALIKKLGPVDILVNNAGIVSGKKLLEIQEEKIIQTINVNVLSLFWTTRAFLPSRMERNSGHIVTIASAAGLIGVKGLSDYCAGKFAAVGFDESLRMELQNAKSKVTTTVVCPYFIDTGMFTGVKTRFPLLLPILSSDNAAKRIVRAILKNRKRLIMPRFVYATLLVRLFPPTISDCLASFFGISNAMDDFTGREAVRPVIKAPAANAGPLSRKQTRPAPAPKAPAMKAGPAPAKPRSTPKTRQEAPARKTTKPAARKAPNQARRGTKAEQGKTAGRARKTGART